MIVNIYASTLNQIMSPWFICSWCKAFRIQQPSNVESSRGGQGLEYWGGGKGGGGANVQQAHDIVLTSMRRSDVASTSFRRHVPT